MITVLCAAFAVVACHRNSDSAPPTARQVTALNSNPRVLDDHGRCHFLVPIHTFYAKLDAPKFEGPLEGAIAAFEQAKASGANRRTLILRAHEVRKRYWKMMNLWRKPLLDEMGGPYRCQARGERYEEISSDDVFRKTDGFTAFVESLSDLPGKYDKDGRP